VATDDLTDETPHSEDGTHTVCLACGQIKPRDYFEEGSTRCRKCVEKGISDQYRPVGDGYEPRDVSVEPPADPRASDCHEADGGGGDAA